MIRRYHNIDIPLQDIAELCQRWHIRRLSLFGSVLRDDFRAESDIDILVEFESGARIGLDFFAIERELSQIIGRKIDLHTPGFLSRHFRDQVMVEAEVVYEAT